MRAVGPLTLYSAASLCIPHIGRLLRFCTYNTSGVYCPMHSMDVRHPVIMIHAMFYEPSGLVSSSSTLGCVWQLPLQLQVSCLVPY